MMVQTASVAPIEVRSGNDGGRLGPDRLCCCEVTQCLGRDGVSSVLALALEGKEKEILVLPDRSSNVAAELLALELRRRGPRGLFGEIIVVVQRSLRVVKIAAAVELVGAGLGDDVDGGTFAAAVGGGETLRGNVEFLNGGKRQLHHGAADSVVLV